MPREHPGPLTPQQLGDLARDTLTNSVELLRDAEGLAVFKRYPRAYSLAVLAAEEFGKHMMCFGAVGRDNNPETWSTFWRRFREHKPKYENAAAMAASSLPPDARKRFEAEFKKHVSADHTRRLAGFYVDWKDGAVVTPDSAVAPDLASDLLLVFTTVIYAWAEYWEGVDFGSMFAGAEGEAAKVQAALLTGNDELIRAAFEETLGPESDDSNRA